MERGRLVIIVLALAAVAVAFAASGRGDDPPDPPSSRASTAPRAPGDALAVSFAYSPEKEDLLAPLIERFNGEDHRSGGQRVFIEADVVPSGDAETRIAAGRLEPALWSPASSFWGRLLNHEAGRPLVADENPSIVRTPLVIAMWKQLADAYGYPRRPLGYRELGELATGGWAAVGKPRFGAFKYVHTNPDFSTSGLSAVAASYYAAAGKREGLTEADVTRARPQVRRLERSIVHYGDTTLFIADELRKKGLGYASAVAMEEVTLLDFNRDAEGADRLVAVYPEEGTFVSDNPLITLQGDWVSDEERRAGAVFADFLAKEITPAVAGDQGFRPAGEDQAPAGLVAPEYGVDPDEPARVLRLPEPEILARLKAAWRADRKPANVLVVFDNSASMGAEGKLSQAKEGLLTFFREAQPHDRIGLVKFSTEITPLVGIASIRRNRERLMTAVRTLLPDEDTRVRDAAVDGVKRVEAQLDRDAINAVVLLTDGEDNRSSRSADEVVRALSRQGRKESGQIRVFTIAYGEEPNAKELKRYAEATGGNAYEASTDDIESVYRQISSYF